MRIIRSSATQRSTSATGKSLTPSCNRKHEADAAGPSLRRAYGDVEYRPFERQGVYGRIDGFAVGGERSAFLGDRGREPRRAPVRRTGVPPRGGVRGGGPAGRYSCLPPSPVSGRARHDAGVWQAGQHLPEEIQYSVPRRRGGERKKD